MPTDIPVEEQVEWAFHHLFLEECNEVYAQSYGFSSAAELVGSDNIRLSDEHEEYRWVTLKSLESEDAPLLPGIAEFARNCKELHND